METPAVRPLKNPDSKRDFLDELPDTFTKDEAIKVGVKHKFSSRKVSRLLKDINGLKINKISHGMYSKIKNE